MAAAIPPPSNWWFLAAVLLVAVLFLTLAWAVARAATRRASAGWPAYRAGVERCGLRLLPFNVGAGDDEDDTEDPMVRQARHRILEFGRGLQLFRDASLGSGATYQPIAEGEADGIWVCAFNLRFCSDGSQFNAWVSDKTVVALAGQWRLPHCVILPRGAGASISRAFDAVDYEWDGLAEWPSSANDTLSEHYRIVGAERNCAADLAPPLLNWLEEHPGTTVEANEGRLIAFRGNRTLSPDAFAALLQDAYSLGRALRPAAQHPDQPLLGAEGRIEHFGAGAASADGKKFRH